MTKKVRQLSPMTQNSSHEAKSSLMSLLENEQIWKLHKRNEYSMPHLVAIVIHTKLGDKC